MPEPFKFSTDVINIQVAQMSNNKIDLFIYLFASPTECFFFLKEWSTGIKKNEAHDYGLENTYKFKLFH